MGEVIIINGVFSGVWKALGKEIIVTKTSFAIIPASEVLNLVGKLCAS